MGSKYHSWAYHYLLSSKEINNQEGWSRVLLFSIMRVINICLIEETRTGQDMINNYEILWESFTNITSITR